MKRLFILLALSVFLSLSSCTSKRDKIIDKIIEFYGEEPPLDEPPEFYENPQDRQYILTYNSKYEMFTAMECLGSYLEPTIGVAPLKGEYSRTFVISNIRVEIATNSLQNELQVTVIEK